MYVYVHVCIKMCIYVFKYICIHDCVYKYVHTHPDRHVKQIPSTCIYTNELYKQYNLSIYKHMNMYICMYSIHSCIYVQVYKYKMDTTHLHFSKYIYIKKKICVYMYMHIYTRTHMYMYMDVRIYARMCIYVYLCIHT